MELTEKYRPKKLDKVVGQDDAVRVMSAMLDRGSVAKCWLFTGPSGCGKTTLARILKRKLKVDDIDFREINAAESRGIDTVREIAAGAKLEPMVSPYRMYLVDECHKLTNDAQNALLKVAEDGGKKGIIVLCTTDPGKLIKTLVTRATEIKVKALPVKELTLLLNRINMKEFKGRLTDAVIERITDVCDGSARKAVKILEQVAGLEDEDAMLDAVQGSDMRNEAFDLVKELLPFQGKPAWTKVRKVLDNLKGEEAEQIRRLVIAVCSSHMLKGNKLAGEAHRVFQAFQYPFYDTGFPGLVAAAWEAVHP